MPKWKESMRALAKNPNVFVKSLGPVEESSKINVRLFGNLLSLVLPQGLVFLAAWALLKGPNWGCCSFFPASFLANPSNVVCVLCGFCGLKKAPTGHAHVEYKKKTSCGGCESSLFRIGSDPGDF